MVKVDTVEYQFDEIVYLRVNEDKKCMVTGFIFRPGCVLYIISWSDLGEKEHYASELTRERSFANDASS